MCPVPTLASEVEMSSACVCVCGALDAHSRYVCRKTVAMSARVCVVTLRVARSSKRSREGKRFVN